MATHQSVLTSTWTFFPSSEVATTRQTDGIAHKLKLRSFHKSAHLWVHSADFHPGVNHAWQYYQTSKSAVTSQQFRLLNLLSQFHLQSISLGTLKSKWLPLAIIPQPQSHRLGHPSTRSRVSVNQWLICQMRHDAQDDSISEAVHFRGLSLLQSNPPGQFACSWPKYCPCGQWS